MKELWRCHSLSITLGGIGLFLIGLAMPLEEGRWFDLWLGLGTAMFSVALFYGFAGPLHEDNDPQD